MKKIIITILILLPAFSFAQSKELAKQINKDTVAVSKSVKYAVVLTEQELQILAYVIDNSQAEHSLVKKVLSFLQQNMQMVNPADENRQKKK